MRKMVLWLGFAFVMTLCSWGCSTTHHQKKRSIPGGQNWDRGVELQAGVQTPSLGPRLLQMKNVFENLESPPLKWTLFVGEEFIRLPDGNKIPVSLKDGAIHLPPSDRMESPRGVVIQSAYEPLRKLFLETVGELGGPTKRPLFVITDERISADLVAALSATGRMSGFGAPIWIGADPENKPVGFVLQGPKPCGPAVPPLLPPPIKEPDGYEHHRMALGQSSIAGQCNAAQIEPVFAEWTEALDQCYALAAEDYPNLIGHHELANVSILLNPSGTVAATSFDGRWSNQYPALSRCIQNTLRVRQYPANEGFCLLSRNLLFSFAHHLDVHHGAPPPPPNDFTHKVSWARVHLYRDATKLQLGIQETGSACSRGVPAFTTLKIKDPEAIVRWVDTLAGAGKRQFETLHIRAEKSATLKDVLRIAESLIQDAGRTQLRFSVVETEVP